MPFSLPAALSPQPGVAAGLSGRNARRSALTKLYRPLCQLWPRRRRERPRGRSGDVQGGPSGDAGRRRDKRGADAGRSPCRYPAFWRRAVCQRCLRRALPADPRRPHRAHSRTRRSAPSRRPRDFRGQLVRTQGRRLHRHQPAPRTIAFAGATDETQEVSVDGGRTWGALEDLMVRDSNGRPRPAHAEDVTHLRWRIPTPQALAGNGQMTWRGVVR